MIKRRFFNRFVTALVAVVFSCYSILVPVCAAEVAEEEWETVPFSFNFVGDTIVFTDENGVIVEVKASDISTYSLLGGTVALGSTGGAIAAGSATVFGPSMLILGVLVLGGIALYNLYDTASVITDIWGRISDTARQELTDIANSGADSYSLTQATLDEITSVADEIFYTDDGSFVDSVLTFDPSGMLEYDYESQRVNSDTLTSSIYKYALSDEPVKLGDTSLYASVVSSPFSDGYECLLIENAVTGVSLTFEQSGFVRSDHCEYFISLPTVETLARSDGLTTHSLGFWILEHCLDDSCSDHYYNYHSFIQRETVDSITTHGVFSGTGDETLDGRVISYQLLRESCWEWFFETALDGVGSVEMPYSMVEAVSSSTVAERYRDATAEYPTSDTVMYLPTADVLADMNYYTSAGVLTNDWTTVLDTPAADTPVTDAGVGGLLSSVWSAVLAIVDGVGSIVSGGSDFIAAIPAFFDSVLDIFMFWKEADAHGAVGH